MTDVIDNVVDTTKTVSDDTKPTPKVYTEEAYRLLEKESVTRRKDNEKLLAEIKKRDEADLTEAQKRDKRISELEAERDKILTAQKDKDIDNLILKKSTGKNIVDIDAVMLFAKKELAGVEDVNDAAVESVIGKILNDKPYLVSTTNVIPGDGNFKKSDVDASKDPDSMFGEFLHGQ